MVAILAGSEAKLCASLLQPNETLVMTISLIADEQSKILLQESSDQEFHRCFQFQAPHVESDEVQNFKVEVRGETFLSTEERKVMIKPYSPMTFVQTDKPIYNPGHTGCSSEQDWTVGQYFIQWHHSAAFSFCSFRVKMTTPVEKVTMVMGLSPNLSVPVLLGRDCPVFHGLWTNAEKHERGRQDRRSSQHRMGLALNLVAHDKLQTSSDETCHRIESQGEVGSSQADEDRRQEERELLRRIFAESTPEESWPGFGMETNDGDIDRPHPHPVRQLQQFPFPKTL
eukprot:XP_014069192.1 PREDICTED: uncharacterized protein LOC106612515 [Salmo salar]